MKRVAFALGFALVGASPALAQYYVPRPPAPIGAMAVEDVLDIVEGMGLRPVGPAMAHGPFLVQRARDDDGRLLNVTVDARRQQVVAIEAAGMPRPPYGRYAGYGPQGRVVYPGHAMDPDDEFAAPGSIMAPRAQPPHAVAPPPRAQQPNAQQQPQKRATKSAAVPPQRAPVPRKRPASAPEQAAAGSVEPVTPAPAPQSAPEPQAGPAQNAPAPAVSPAPAQTLE